jgi:hypothetical protein
MSLLCSQKLPKSRPVNSMDPSVARAAFLTSTLWPVGDTIRIYFIEPVPNNLEWKSPWTTDSKFLDPLYQNIQGKVDPKTLVKTVVQERLSPIVNVKFEFTTDVNQSDIRILFREGIGCSSIVGNSRSKAKFSSGEAPDMEPKGQPEPTMKYSWLDISTVLHEFCHALGMIHEHQNPQGNPIKWNEPAVYCYYKSVNPRWTDNDVKRNVLDTYKTDQINGSAYDPASIMIYSFPDKVECNNREDYLTLNSPPLQINPNYRLSNTDVELLKMMYPFEGKRDVKSIENVPVIPTEVYQLSDNAQLIRQFFEDNYKTLVGVVGGFVGLIIIYKLVRWMFSKKQKDASV